jgi:hypothetical protein
MNSHWAEPYRNAASGTLEAKLWLAACYIVCCAGRRAEHEAFCRRVAKIAFDEDCSIWHAAWLAHGSHGECHCAVCQRSV